MLSIPAATEDAIVYMKESLVAANAARVAAIEAGDIKVIGVNAYRETEPSPLGAGVDAIMTVDPAVDVGTVHLRGPVMTASGTAGYGTELAPYGDLSILGAIVTKSLSAEPWAGHPPPRLAPTAQGMLNAVGLQGPGIDEWRHSALPGLLASGVSAVVRILPVVVHVAVRPGRGLVLALVRHPGIASLLVRTVFR